MWIMLRSKLTCKSQIVSSLRERCNRAERKASMCVDWSVCVCACVGGCTHVCIGGGGSWYSPVHELHLSYPWSLEDHPRATHRPTLLKVNTLKDHPDRLADSTRQQSCPQNTAEESPYSCPRTQDVGSLVRRACCLKNEGSDSWFSFDT